MDAQHAYHQIQKTKIRMEKERGSEASAVNKSERSQADFSCSETEERYEKEIFEIEEENNWTLVKGRKQNKDTRKNKAKQEKKIEEKNTSKAF